MLPWRSLRNQGTTISHNIASQRSQWRSSSRSRRNPPIASGFKIASLASMQALGPPSVSGQAIVTAVIKRCEEMWANGVLGQLVPFGIVGLASTFVYTVVYWPLATYVI